MSKLDSLCVSDHGACPFWAILVALGMVVLSATAIPAVIYVLVHPEDVLMMVNRMSALGKVISLIIISGIIVGGAIWHTGCNCPCKLLRISCP